MEIRNKNIVITGASQGLGRAFAVGIAKEGGNLALVDINTDKLQETANLCKKHDVKISLYGANVTEKEQVRTLFSEVEKDFGQVDGLINNAGITRDGLLAKYSDGEVKLMSTDDWQQVINVNLTGVFLCGREAAASMMRSKNGGVIINISSISKAGNYGQSNYVAAKSGVAAMVVTWAKELAKYNIRVCGIAPGFVNTEMVAAMPEKVLAKTIATVPLRRLAEPQEIFHAAKFAMENDYFSGRTLSLDGGLRI